MAQPKYPVRSLLKPIVDWFGRLGRKNAPSVSTKISTTSAGLVQSIVQYTPDTELWDLFFTPYVWAGLRFRASIAKLWTGASPTKNEQGDINSPAQIQALDLDGNELDSDQLQATRWLFDTHLKEGQMTKILKEISYAKLILKKSVHEILWAKATDGEYAGKILIDGFRHVDPTLFEYNPQGYKPGLYLQKVNEYGMKEAIYEEVDERRFLVVTNQLLFGDKNGISELEPLRKCEPRRADAEKNWGRGAQRHGHGHIIGYYGNALLGAGAETDRANYQTSLENMNTDTVTMVYGGEGSDSGNRIDQLNVDIKADVFSSFIDELKTQISVVLTGSPVTLKEGKFGSRSMAESTQVREKSDLEQQDCAEISAAFTEQVIRRFCDFNWLQTEVYPKMQLISEEQNAPTTPDAQDTLIDQQSPNQKPTLGQQHIAKQRLIKLQAKEEPKEPTIPVAIPAGNKDFPDKTPLSDNVKDVLDYARDVLNEMPVKEYTDVQPNEAPFIFTVKRFRGYTADMLPIMQEMKQAIADTLAEPTEEDAWTSYFLQVVPILQSRGINMTPDIRDDLNISFRQARQNVFGEALYQKALDDPDIIGLRIVNRPSNNHHEVHTFWDGVAIPKNHPELQRGGKLRTPMDFGCICEYEYVYEADALTAESDWPSVFPGETYRYYAQPTTRQPEAQ